MVKSDVLTRSYWYEQRRRLLAFAVVVFMVNLPLTTQFDIWSDPTVFTQVWMIVWAASLIALPASLLLTTKQELSSISKWAFIGAFGMATLQVVIHRTIMSGMTMDQFTGDTLLGSSISALVGGAGVLAIGTAIVFVAKYVYYRRMGGSGGTSTTPEEDVLSDEEYADFEPIETTGREQIEPNAKPPFSYN